MFLKQCELFEPNIVCYKQCEILSSMFKILLGQMCFRNSVRCLSQMRFRNNVKCLRREEKLVLFSAIAVHFWIALIPTQMVVINCQRWWEPFLSFCPYLCKHFLETFRCKNFPVRKTLAFLRCVATAIRFSTGEVLARGNIWPCDRGSCNTRVWEIVFLYWISSDIAFWYPLYPCMMVGIKIW